MDMNMNMNSMNSMMLMNIVFSKLNLEKLNLEKINYFYSILFLFVFIIYNNKHVYYFDYIIKLINNKKTNKLVFTSSDIYTSNRYKSIMFYISKTQNINELKECQVPKYNYKKHVTEESLHTLYFVNQKSEFKINDSIYGRVEFTEKQVNDGTKSFIKEVIIFTIFSNKLKLNELINFVEQCNDEYKIYVKEKSLGEQLFIDIFWNTSKSGIETMSSVWKSSTTFDSIFFDNKKDIVKKINFFLKEKEWYIKKGKAHTLGILLSGPPGTGKSSFIKSISNLTKKHIINIKLSDNFDFNVLEKIMYSDELNENLVIPLNNRIIVFEDIDCMTEIIKDRKLIKSEAEVNKLKDNLDESIEKINQKNNDNSLNILLNMLDGIKEQENRIIIATTNNPEILDKALIRPGRIDINLNLNNASLNNIVDILSHFWDVKTSEFIIEKIIVNKEENIISKFKQKIIPLNWHQKISHAEITNICCSSDDLLSSMIKISNFVKNN